jgi:hypothetical protein
VEVDVKRYSALLVLITVAFCCSCSKPLFTVVPSDPLPTRNPNPETARVVFFRPAEGFLSAYHIGIYDENQLIGILPSTSYFTYDAQPGKHIFGSLYFFKIDFLEADIEAGKTYYVFCGLYDTFIGGINCKIIAIKKGSENMRKVPEWFYRSRRTELSAEGIEYYKVKSDEKGKYLIGRQGRLFTSRLDIETIRKKWIERAKTTGKPPLLSEDGEETLKIIQDRNPRHKKHSSRKRTNTVQEKRLRPSKSKQATAKRSYHFPSAGDTLSIEGIPSGELTDTMILNLFTNKIVKGTHRRKEFSFERHFRSDGFLMEKSPQKGQRSGKWRTKKGCLCIRWKNKEEKCGNIIKTNGRIHQYRVKKSGAKVQVVTFEEFATIHDGG